MVASILSNGRQQGAFGMAGGQPGAPGLNRVVRADGRVAILAGLALGDRVATAGSFWLKSELQKAELEE